MTRPYCQRRRSCRAGERGYCPLCTPNIAEIRAKISAGRQRQLKQSAVPAWASKAGLFQDYRDTAATHGEHAAAQLCRRLIKETIE